MIELKNKKTFSFSFEIHTSDLYNRDQEKNLFFSIFYVQEITFLSSFHALKKNFSSLIFDDENQI